MFKKAAIISFGVIAEEKLPISLAWLSGVFERVHVEYEVHDFNHELYVALPLDLYRSLRHNTLKSPPKEVIEVIDTTVQRIVDQTPDILSVSVFSYRQYDVARIFLERFATVAPDSVTRIIGGPGVWYIPPGSGKTCGYSLATEGLIDYYALGNGEEVIVDFLQGVDPSALLGMNSLEKLEANDYVEEWTELVRKIQDKYIEPSYRKIPILNHLKQKKEILITGANGCPGRCAFCSIREYIPFPSYRDGVDVANECYKLFKQTGVTRFRRTDALANGHTKHFKAFNERIIQLRKDDPSFTFEYNAMFLPKDSRIQDEEYYRIMAEAGCKTLDLGIESGSERLRVDMHKEYTDAQLDWHFAMCQKFGIKNNISIFVGFPTETEEDFNQNLRMLERYQKYVEDGTFYEIQHCGKFVLYTKTYIYNNLDEYNVVITDESSDPIQWTCTTNPTNTPEERLRREHTFLQKARELGYRVDVYDSADKYD